VGNQSLRTIQLIGSISLSRYAALGTSQVAMRYFPKDFAQHCAAQDDALAAMMVVMSLFIKLLVGIICTYYVLRNLRIAKQILEEPK
jgi:uncharacterized protein YneF (UPF0154 family)